MTFYERIEALLNRAGNTISDIPRPAEDCDMRYWAAIIDRLEWALENTLDGIEVLHENEEIEKCSKVGHDAVNHPSHYTAGGIECIDAMRAAFGKDELLTYCKINAFKYLWRADLKNGDEDIQKAAWYINKYKALKEEKQ